MIAELSEAPPPMVGETSLPPPLEADIALVLILPDLAIDLAIGRLLFVRIFFNQDPSELLVRVWGKGLASLVLASSGDAHTCKI
jgi:hypothetical protein